MCDSCAFVSFFLFFVDERQIDGDMWLYERVEAETEAILLTFSNLINLLLIEDHRHLYNNITLQCLSDGTNE
jgi:hypothetical protein